MKERGWIEPIVERVVGQVLDSHAAQLRTEIVRRVMEEIAAEPELSEPEVAIPAADVTASSPADLARAVAEIQLGASQKEILRALLDTSARYASRVALFVVKGSHATGWQARGFVNGDGIKDFGLDENAPAVSHAIVDRVPVTAPVSDLDPRFVQQFEAPANGQARMFPLILKEKVAALIYADSGTNSGGLLDAGALELLVLSTSAWLEVNSLRKLAQKEPAPAEGQAAEARATASSPAPFAPAPAAQAFNDPFAAHAPAFATGHAKAAAASASAAPAAEITPAASKTTERPAAAHEPQIAVAEMEPALAEPLPMGQADAPVPQEPAPADTLSPEDQDVHRKAQRFARLLVDEIKLYNQAKVAEGRKNKDLYDRLKETIDKSRSTYQKRYGTTVAATANYFQHEIIRSLAEDDLSIMGANFRH
jgi:hypothetical protein